MNEEQEPKIIVDDDWKEQVQKEKEQLEGQADGGDSAAYQMPEASFSLLVTTLTTQALSAMGFVPNPVTGKADVNRDLAKHFIDSLAVLEEKTKGNLTDEENGLLNESLHQLRMAFVTPPPTGADPTPTAPESQIELP